MSVDAKVRRRVGLGLLCAALIALAAQRGRTGPRIRNAADTGHVSEVMVSERETSLANDSHAGALNGIAIGDNTVVVTNQARFQIIRAFMPSISPQA